MSCEKIKPINYSNLGKILDIVLSDTGYSNKHISSQTGLTQKTLERVRSIGAPEMQTFVHLCNYTNVNANFLLGKSLNPYPYRVNDPSTFYKRVYALPIFDKLMVPNNTVSDNKNKMLLDMDYLIQTLGINHTDEQSAIIEKFNTFSTANLNALLTYFYNIYIF